MLKLQLARYDRGRLGITLLATIAIGQSAAIASMGYAGVFHALPVFVGLSQYKAPANKLASWHDIQLSEPRLGSSIQLASYSDESGKSYSFATIRKPIAVLLVSGCRPCMATYLQKWSNIERRTPGTLFLISSANKNIDEIQDYRKVYGLTTHFIVSSDDTLRNSLNPFFQPRAYLFDAQQRLVYIQSSSTSTLTAIRRIASLADSKGFQRK
jgi:hypothetical protein